VTTMDAAMSSRRLMPPEYFLTRRPAARQTEGVEQLAGSLPGVPRPEEAEGWTVFFPPEVFGSGAPGAFLSWRAHPLLFPFVRGAADIGRDRPVGGGGGSKGRL
jgi:hypothetical protein